MKKTATSREQAWEMANEIFPTDYDKDEVASKNAGYDIYRHHELNHFSKICDLGNRLEVITGEHGETVTNIWIEPISTANIYAIEFNGKPMGWSTGTNEYNALKGFGLTGMEMQGYEHKGRTGGVNHDSWTYTAENAKGIIVTITRAA